MMIWQMILFTVVVLTPSTQGHARLLPFKSATVQLQLGTVSPGSVDPPGELLVSEDIFGLRITGIVKGLSPGNHGFHIHEEGLLTNECADAGGHFNPTNRKHGDPRDFHRHVGDLGNIYANALGVATVNILDKEGTLNPLSNNFVGNRAIVVHAGEDDLGLGGDAGSLTTGNAGARIACGVIKVNFNPFSPLFNSAGKSKVVHIVPTQTYFPTTGLHPINFPGY